MAQDTAQKIGALEQQVQKYLQEQKPQLAIPVLREIVSLDAGNVNGQANLGVLLFFQGDYAEAIPHMRAALQLQPDLWRVAASARNCREADREPERGAVDLERTFSHLDDPRSKSRPVWSWSSSMSPRRNSTKLWRWRGSSGSWRRQILKFRSSLMKFRVR